MSFHIDTKYEKRKKKSKNKTNWNKLSIDKKIREIDQKYKICASAKFHRWITLG